MDIYRICMFVIVRGTIHHKIKKNLDPSALSVFNDLVRVYCIKSRAVAEDDFTLGRCTTVLGPVVGFLMWKGYGKELVKVNNLPRCLSFPGSSSIIPLGEEWKSLIERIIDWNRLFGVLISSKTTDIEMRKIVMLQWNDSIYTDEQRKSFMRLYQVNPGFNFA